MCPLLTNIVCCAFIAISAMESLNRKERTSSMHVGCANCYTHIIWVKFIALSPSHSQFSVLFAERWDIKLE